MPDLQSAMQALESAIQAFAKCRREEIKDCTAKLRAARLAYEAAKEKRDGRQAGS